MYKGNNFFCPKKNKKNKEQNKTKKNNKEGRGKEKLVQSFTFPETPVGG